MDEDHFRKLTLSIAFLALVLSVSAVYVSYTPRSDAVAGGQPAKTGIDTHRQNVTTTEDGISIFSTRMHAYKNMSLRHLVIYWETPVENHTLTPAETDNPDELTGAHFTVQVLRDRNDSAPTLDHITDLVQIVIRPPTFLDSNESRLGPVTLIIDAPGIFREKMVITNVTTTADIDLPASTPKATPTPEDEWFDLDRQSPPALEDKPLRQSLTRPLTHRNATASPTAPASRKNSATSGCPPAATE
jgi:hypothetical protein